MISTNEYNKSGWKKRNSHMDAVKSILKLVDAARLGSWINAIGTGNSMHK